MPVHLTLASITTNQYTTNVHFQEFILNRLLGKYKFNKISQYYNIGGSKDMAKPVCNLVSHTTQRCVIKRKTYLTDKTNLIFLFNNLYNQPKNI